MPDESSRTARAPGATGSPDGRTTGRRQTPRSALRRGAFESVALILSYLPFGLVFGATLARASVDNVTGWSSSWLIFAGASQLAIVDLLDRGAAAFVVVLTGLVINLRHVMYSGGLAPWFRESPLGWQLAAPYVLTDPVYSLSVVRFPELPDDRTRRAYYLGLGVTLWLGWLSMTAAGVLLGARLPSSWPLDLGVPLTFLALLAPSVTDRPTALAAVVGGMTTVAAQGLPLELGLLVGAFAGIAAGLAAERATGEVVPRPGEERP